MKSVKEISRSIRGALFFAKFFTGNSKTRAGICVEFDNHDITITVGRMDENYDLIGFGEKVCEWREGDDEI